MRTGNMGLRDTKALFAMHLCAIAAALATCSLVEIDRQTVRAVT
jgi:hypothetical protein